MVTATYLAFVIMRMIVWKTVFSDYNDVAQMYETLGLVSGAAGRAGGLP
jgi:hypothetical protein